MNRFCCALLLALMGFQASAPAIESHQNTLYVQLIRGTDHEGRQEPTWKPIGPKLSQRLSPVFRWKRYYEVNCQPISIELGRVSRSRLSDIRQVEIEPLNASEMEIRLYRDGKLTQTSRQLMHTRMAIMGGDRIQNDSWFVVVRRDKPQ